MLSLVLFTWLTSSDHSELSFVLMAPERPSWTQVMGEPQACDLGAPCASSQTMAQGEVLVHVINCSMSLSSRELHEGRSWTLVIAVSPVPTTVSGT